MCATRSGTDVPVYQIKVTLRGTKPPIWRRIHVQSDTTLAELHVVLQVVMGWYDAHLHQFIVGQTYFGEPHPDYFDYVDMHDESQFSLNQIVAGEKFKFRYEYDFGDSWEHDLLVEKMLPPEPGQHYPVCIKGRGACPPEDVGGVWGYYAFLEAIQNPEHPEHEDYLVWIGDDFDPADFDLEEVNQALRILR